ncbi:MAG: phosphate acetyltransferase [Gaiellaceae bacterium]
MPSPTDPHSLARNLYITAMEPQSGKSIVALGLMELLSARVEGLGFFRPIVSSDTEPDPEIELIRRRYELRTTLEEMHALSEGEAGRIGSYDELKKRVVEAYKTLERQCEFVVCEGTDFAGTTPALEFGRNADLANELGAPVVAVVKGGSPEETVASVRVARAALEEKGCSLFGVFVNFVRAELVDEVATELSRQDGSQPVYVLPEQPELAYPSVAEVAADLRARVLFDPREALHRPVRDVRVAAMSVEHFLDDLVDGTLVIVPGDRSDILVATLASGLSPAVATVSGVVLTGEYPLSETLLRLLERAPFPVLEVSQATHVAASAVSSVPSLIRAENERKIAMALGLFESAVDTAELGRRIVLDRPRRVTPIMFEYELIERAKADRKHIVLPESEDDRVLRATEILLRRGVVDLTVLGDPEEVGARAAALGVDLNGAQVVDPLTSPLRDGYAARYFGLRKHKNVTEELAYDVVGDPCYFGTMMVEAGAVHGLVSGAVHTTGDTIRPAFEVIRAREGVSVVSSVFFMCLSDRVLVYGDCAVNPKPDTEQLADIAISAAETAASFGIEPRIAMLSYSTGESGKGHDVDAVRAATEAVRKRRPELKVEGPIQYDAAVDASVAKLKLPGSEVAGRATVFIFPDLDTGNVAYKAVQRSAKAVAIGPVLQGLRKPVNDLSRGCTVTDIVNTVAITAIQAQSVE